MIHPIKPSTRFQSAVGGIGFTELLLLAIIALLVVGPQRLPEIARTAGQLSKTARAAWQSLKSEFQAELDLEHNKNIMKKSKGSLVSDSKEEAESTDAPKTSVDDEKTPQ